MLLGEYNLISQLSTRKHHTDEAILQIPSSFCPTLHDEVTNTDKKTSTGLPSSK
jgi:hypothetical protein